MFLSFCVLDDILRFPKKSGFGVFLAHLETPLPDGLETSGRRAYRLFWHIFRRFWVLAFLVIFSVFQKNWVLGHSWSTLLWYRCYYLHRLRDALSPVCGILKASAHWADAFYKSKCPSVCTSVCPSVCVFVCLFTFEVPLNGLFAPSSQSRISNIFRDSESLGKSNGKKWSNIWTFSFGSGLKSTRNLFFFWFCLTKHGGNHASRLETSGRRVYC